MIKHVVMWKLKELAEGNEKSKNISLMKEKLFELKSIINQIQSLEVGENFNTSDAAYDLVLTTTHRDKNGLYEYINHSAHQEVAAFIGEVVADRKVVDYET